MPPIHNSQIQGILANIRSVMKWPPHWQPYFSYTTLFNSIRLTACAKHTTCMQTIGPFLRLSTQLITSPVLPMQDNVLFLFQDLAQILLFQETCLNPPIMWYGVIQIILPRAGLSVLKMCWGLPSEGASSLCRAGVWCVSCMYTLGWSGWVRTQGHIGLHLSRLEGILDSHFLLLTMWESSQVLWTPFSVSWSSSSLSLPQSHPQGC